MLRKIWAICYFIPLTFFMASVALFIGRFDCSGRVGMWCGYHWSRLFLNAAGIRIRADLTALDDLSPNVPCVLMVNHQSYLDVFTLFSLFPQRTLSFIAKGSIFRIPIFGAAMRQAGHVPINRNHPRSAMKSIEFAMNQSYKGYTVVIFPEGTRNKQLARLVKYKIGGIVLAIKCGLPVIPLVIVGSHEAMSGSIFTLDSVHREIYVRALSPLVVDGYYTLKDREQLRDNLYTLMNTAYLKLRSTCSIPV